MKRRTKQKAAVGILAGIVIGLAIQKKHAKK